jgi:hypothetical protein
MSSSGLDVGMAKSTLITVRVDAKELRAVNRWARVQGKTVADLVRGRVVEPALSFDPRQAELPWGKEARKM